MEITDNQDNNFSPDHLIPATSISSSSKTKTPEIGLSANFNDANQVSGQQMDLYIPVEDDQSTLKKGKMLTITGPAKTWKRIEVRTGRLQREPVTHIPILIDNISGSKRSADGWAITRVAVNILDHPNNLVHAGSHVGHLGYARQPNLKQLHHLLLHILIIPLCELGIKNLCGPLLPNHGANPPRQIGAVTRPKLYTSDFWSLKLIIKSDMQASSRLRSSMFEDLMFPCAACCAWM
ncbi:isocitrate lyase [Striga asiatica]|uniref:Isocitrate lyase n=1 Tax=Striga asiatica TaxID=4170 RepID=A0A5A7QLN6_STRAF|nr:isocitrate lyase [Striga asiatica]